MFFRFFTSNFPVVGKIQTENLLLEKWSEWDEKFDEFTAAAAMAIWLLAYRIHLHPAAPIIFRRG